MKAIFKKLEFEQCYGKFICNQCKKGGHSKWLCAWLHQMKQPWLNMYEVSYQKGLAKPEFNQSVGNGRYSVNSIDTSNSNNNNEKTGTQESEIDELINGSTMQQKMNMMQSGSALGFSDKNKIKLVDSMTKQWKKNAANIRITNNNS